MRISVISKIVLAAAIAVVLMPVSSAQAQQYRGSGNSKIRTIGDLARSKIKAPTSTNFSLSFSNLGLFGDSEVPQVYERPNPFVFSVPNFAERGFDFSDMTYDEYLTFVANSYELNYSYEYNFMFQNQNERTIVGDYLLFDSQTLSDQFYTSRSSYESQLLSNYGASSIYDLTYDQYLEYYQDINGFLFELANQLEANAVNAVHEEDFLAGGGFFRFEGEPTVPVDPGTLPEEDVFDPFPGNPVTPVVGASDSSAAEQTAAAVLSVPEPATLALISLGAAGLFTRRR